VWCDADLFAVWLQLLIVIKRGLDQRVSLLRVVVDAMAGRSADSEVALYDVLSAMQPNKRIY
jgi:hypothetical protein